MSFNLVTFMMQYLNSDLVSKMAKASGLDEVTAQKAIGALVPIMLGSLAAHAASPGGASRLTDVIGSLDPETLTRLGGIVAGPNHGALAVEGNQLLSRVIGMSGVFITGAVSKYAGLNSTAADSLAGTISPAVLGALAHIVRSNGLDSGALAGLLVAQKDNISAGMPAEFIKSMGGSLPSWEVPAATPEGFVRRINADKDLVRGERMAKRIFISYRRDDSAGHAGRVFDRLQQEFGQDLLFMDVDAIPLGVNFVRVLRAEVAKCDVLLAIIGPRWLDARDDDGHRRLDNPTDFVRIEISTALQRDIPVIPILLDGTRMPKPTQLPPDLHPLSERNGLDVRHASFQPDLNKLIRELKL
jgi:Bacterial protein of unknown function (DUF937)/TIR domain